MEKIGIFGGTFNPPHVGHINAAVHAAKVLQLDKLYMIPTLHTPSKHMPSGSPVPQQRLDMLRIAAQPYPQLEVSDIELLREGESYTWDTVAQFRSENPNAEIYLLVGSDMFLSFGHWVNADRIAKEATIAVLCRGAKGEKTAIREACDRMTTSGSRVVLVENAVCPISSTQLRRMLAFGCADSFLPEGVGDYIRENGLYQVNTDWKRLPMDQLEAVVISLLNPNRVKHVLGCRDTAVELARHWGANEEDAARAGILHDITKALDGPLQLTLCDAYGKILSDFSKKYPKTLHALTGSLVAERIFGENKEVVSAICHHTTGKADMSLLEMIIYVADYMEPNRDFPGVEQLRQLAFSDIRAALKLGLEMTLVHLKNQGNEVSPASREALEYLDRQGLT